MLSAVATAAVSMTTCTGVCSGWNATNAGIWLTCLSLALCGLPVAMISRYNDNDKTHTMAAVLVAASGMVAMAGLIPLAHHWDVILYRYSIFWFVVSCVLVLTNLSILKGSSGS